VQFETEVKDHFQALRLFVRVARSGSFSKGAREMKVSQPTASRIIALLEEELGVTLFLRSTRALTLTEAGSDYLARIRPVLDSLDEANDAIRGSGDLRGTLRVGVLSIMAARAIVPCLPAFIERHPALKVELMVDDRRQDLIQDGIDVAVRFGKLPDSSALVRLVGRWPLVVAASPSYLARHGIPENPEDLSNHAFVIAGPVAGKGLTFKRDGREVSIQPTGQVAIDGAEVAVSAVRAGLGVAVASLPSFSQDLERGDLVRLLPDWHLGEIEAHALFASNQAVRPAATAFVEHLVSAASKF
jgi:DNA-binding transcriptional LysR family regulator